MLANTFILMNNTIGFVTSSTLTKITFLKMIPHS